MIDFKSILRNVSTLVVLTLFLGCDPVDVEPQQVGLELDYTYFVVNVNPLFSTPINARVCSDSGCHNVNGGSGGSFRLYPNLDSNANACDPEMLANYISAKAFANLNSAENSKLVLEPLAGSFSLTGSHAGGDIFPDTADPNYTAIISWINGAFLAPGGANPSCPGLN